jgi:AAA family ATPase
MIPSSVYCTHYLQALFKRARAAAPTIVFFDEIDAIAGKRSGSGSGSGTERVLSQLLIELDGIQPLKRVVVVAATNRCLV